MGRDIDLFFKRNYEPVMKDHCPGILSCLSNGRKSIKISTSTGKTEHLFTEHLLVAVSLLLKRAGIFISKRSVLFWLVFRCR